MFFRSSSPLGRNPLQCVNLLMKQALAEQPGAVLYFTPAATIAPGLLPDSFARLLLPLQLPASG